MIKITEVWKSIKNFPDYEVLSIKQFLRLGVSQKVLAKMFSVDRTNISSIKTGKTWTHIREKDKN